MLTSSGTRAVPFTITATKIGTLAIAATVEGTAGDGKLFDPRDNSIQRGWIAQWSTSNATVRLAGEVGFDTPTVVTPTWA